MPVLSDIRAAWTAPGVFLGAKLAEGAREDRALAILMGACGLSFVAQWPGLSRAAHLDASVPLDARMGGALMGALFLLPLLAYGLAGLSHLVARVLGGGGTWFGARLALFWAFLAVQPLVLLMGLVVGFLGSGTAATVTGLAVFAAFMNLWLRMLVRAETGAAQWT
ncbi:MAG: YIP1 family protein [Paracoccaceae bacterium]|nr:MAG: YIP1 family protein [Paracoccaceae bacterium]